MNYAIRIYVAASLAVMAAATIDINLLELEMVASSLTLQECRRLVETLHYEDFDLRKSPTGQHEAPTVSCLRLLEHWNDQENRNGTFHLLAHRLEQLGHKDVADRLSVAVLNEKIGESRHHKDGGDVCGQMEDSFLKNPFHAVLTRDSDLLEDAGGAPTTLPDVGDFRPHPWSVLEVGLAVGLGVLTVYVALAGAITLLRLCLPDSYHRMRRALYVDYTGLPPDSEENRFFCI